MTHVINLTVRLNRPIHPDAAMPLARAWAEKCGLVVGMCSHGPDGTFSTSGMIRPDDDRSPYLLPERLERAANALVRILGDHGHQVADWDECEVLSRAAVDRRLEAVSFPECVSAAQFADMLGVTRQRVYQLESDRKAGRDTTGFPRPILEGYWIRTMAETYRDNRRAKPGPAPRVTS